MNSILNYGGGEAMNELTAENIQVLVDQAMGKRPDLPPISPEDTRHLLSTAEALKQQLAEEQSERRRWHDNADRETRRVVELLEERGQLIIAGENKDAAHALLAEALKQQLAEKDAALGALVEAALGMRDGFDDIGVAMLNRHVICNFCGQTPIHAEDCPGIILENALAPGAVQQAASRYREALAIVERVKDAGFLGNAILRWVGFPDERPFARVAAVEQVQKALLGEEKP